MRLTGATGLPELDAADDFMRARRRAFLGAAAHLFAGRPPDCARRPPAIRPSGRPRLEVVALDEITGAVEQVPGFDAALRPTSDRVRRRWEAIALAHHRGDSLAPVELWRTSHGLLVADGRHRVSVARALGLADIDAWVTADAR